jgi:hypothetical protein
MWMVHWIHGYTSHRWTYTAPPLRTGLADFAQAMLFITNFTNRCTTLAMNAPNLA